MAQRGQIDSNGDEDEDEEEKKCFTVKTQLKSICQPVYRDIIIAAVIDYSNLSTRICALASLLFLNRCQRAFDDKHYAFFQLNGEKVIRDCFLGVLEQHINGEKMLPEFRQLVNELYGINFIWPNNALFGNGLYDLAKTYTINVKNNVFVHRKKRLREYLRMHIYKMNQCNPIVALYDDTDINNVISLAIYGCDNIASNDINAPAKRERRDNLLESIIKKHCWWEFIPHNNISRYSKKDWFKSIQFWISLQREIDEFNTVAESRDERQLQREQIKEQKRCKRRQHRQCTCKPKTSPDQSEHTKKGPPKINNLSVIPICGFTRTHYTLDNRTLYYLLCKTNIIPLCKGKTRKLKRSVSQKEFFASKEYYWGQIFDLNKIKSFVHGKKKFRLRLLSNGQAVSILYDFDKKEPVPIDKQAIVDKYKKGGFDFETGTDPGMNTWNATTQRNIETGKEVSVKQQQQNTMLYCQHNI